MSLKSPTQSHMDAAGWLVRLRDENVSSEELAAFGDWLREAPANVQAYLRAVGLWEQLGSVDLAGDIDIDAVLAASNIVPLTERRPAGDKQPPKHRGHRRRWLGSIAASIVIAGMAGAAWWLSLAPDNSPLNVSTGLGEQRSVALDDGSVLELNTQSTVRVVLGPELRRAKLIEGEALFDIAKDPDRPFVVEVDDMLIRVVGTRFNVRRFAEATTVTVLEGEVAVSQTTIGPDDNKQASGSVAQLPVEAVKLQPGMQTTVGKAVTRAAPEIVDPEKVIAWMDRRLIFEGATIDHIVAEFNRYNMQRLIVSDTAIGSRRLTGTFDANDTESLLQFLQKTQSITTVTRPDGYRELVVAAPPIQ